MPSKLHVAYGGTFLATKDVPRLVAWYRALGVPIGDDGYGFLASEAREPDPARDVVFSIQPARPGLAENPKQAIEEEPYGQRRVTLNLRVNSLDEVVAGLRARGEPIAGPTDAGYGKFAWVHDPDGNVVEIWEPAREG